MAWTSLQPQQQQQNSLVSLNNQNYSLNSEDYMNKLMKWYNPTDNINTSINENSPVSNQADWNAINAEIPQINSTQHTDFNLFSWLKNQLVAQDPNTGKTSLGTGATVGKLALGAFNSWQGMQNTNLMKDQLNFQKDSFNKQYNNQVNLLNTQMEDRQRSRYASDPNFFQSPTDYMKQHKLT